MKRSLTFSIILSTMLFALGQTVVFGVEVGRDKAFSKNKILHISANEESLSNISQKLAVPGLTLRGASDEEKKELLSAFFYLGVSVDRIAYNYVNLPLDGEISEGVTVKESIIENLKIIRDIMAKLEAEEKLLELVDEIINKIEKEDIYAEKANPEVKKLFDILTFDKIPKHIENTYGITETLYYEFGFWTFMVMNLCEERIIYDESLRKKLTKKESEEVLEELAKQLKELLARAGNYKSDIEEMIEGKIIPKAVVRNLGDLHEIAERGRLSFDIPTAKKVYGHCTNVYYGMLPER